MATAPIQVYCTERYEGLRSRLCEHEGFERGEFERHSFPDGERYRRLVTECAGRDVVVLGGTVDEVDTLEVYDMACTLVDYGVHTLTLVVPWFGYQTMERTVEHGEVVTAKTRARLLSSIPIAGSGNRIVLLDLHSEGITQYFSGNIRPVHLRATPIVLDLIRRLGGESFCLGATDAGRAKWVETLANKLGVDAGFVFKRRVSGDHTEVTALAADVTGKTVVIYDDMIRTGGSLLGAARAFRDAGAAHIAAVCTHGVFPGDSLSKLQQSGLLDAVACTDSHPHALEVTAEGFLTVESVAGLVSDFLRQQTR